MSGPSGYGSACEDEAGFFIDSGYGSRGCGDGEICNPLERSGACCSNRDDRFRNLCFDNMPPSKCARIMGYYWGDDTTCDDRNVQCMFEPDSVIRCCWKLASGAWAGDWVTMEQCRDRADALGGGDWELIPRCGRYCPSSPVSTGGCCFWYHYGDPGAGWGCDDIYHNATSCDLQEGGSEWLGRNVACNNYLSDCPFCVNWDGAPIPPVFGGEGACWIIGSTSCSQATSVDCDNINQSWAKAGTSCDASYPGACCIGCGVCVDDMPNHLCVKAGGTWQGQTSLCSGVEC